MRRRHRLPSPPPDDAQQQWRRQPSPARSCPGHLLGCPAHPPSRRLPPSHRHHAAAPRPRRRRPPPSLQRRPPQVPQHQPPHRPGWRHPGRSHSGPRPRQRLHAQPLEPQSWGFRALESRSAPRCLHPGCAVAGEPRQQPLLWAAHCRRTALRRAAPRSRSACLPDAQPRAPVGILPSQRAVDLLPAGQVDALRVAQAVAHPPLRGRPAELAPQVRPLPCRQHLEVAPPGRHPQPHGRPRRTR
mmetsp:Transcript_46640/g.118055  ORF Transcript_46640/g.118055 Transcript_46640/m.118055 type:complete len:243 (+) Transcript_46640:574-1302(+)